MITVLDIEKKATDFGVSTGRVPTKLLLGQDDYNEFLESFYPKERISQYSRPPFKPLVLESITTNSATLKVVKTKYSRYFRVV